MPTPTSPDDSGKPRPVGSALPPPRTGAPRQRAEREKDAEPVSMDEMMNRLRREGGSGRRRRSSSSGSSRGADASTDESPRRREPEGRADEGSRRRRSGEGGRRSKDRIDRTLSLEGPASPRRSRKWIVLGVGLVTVGAGLFFGYRALSRYRIEGDGFRVNVARKMTEVLDRKVSLARIRMSGGDAISTTSAVIDMGGSDLVERVSLADVQAVLTSGSWVSNEWVITALNTREAALTFNPVKVRDGALAASEGVRPVPRENSGNGFRFGLSSDPSLVTLERGRFESFTATWPGPDGTPQSLAGLQGSFLVKPVGAEAHFVRGLFTSGMWPDIPVSNLDVNIEGTRMEIVNARLGFTAESEVELSGTADLRPEGGVDLQVAIEPVLLKYIIPAGWSQIVMGQFEAPAAKWKSQFRPGGAPAELNGPFRIRGLALRGMGFVTKIAAALQQPDFVLLEFPEATGEFSWTPERTVISGLSADKGGMLHLSGDITVTADGHLSGDLTLKVNDLLLKGLSNPLRVIFPPAEDGVSVLTFSVGGATGSTTDSIPVPTPIAIAPDPQPPVAPAPAPVPVPAPRAAPLPVPGAPAPTKGDLEDQFQEYLKQ